MNRIEDQPVAPGTIHHYVIETDFVAEKMYCTEFVVIGRGDFPFDMLRYDQCHPVGSEDAGNLPFERAIKPNLPRRIKLRSWNRQKFWRPTYERWRSFGWSVTSTVTD